MRYYNAAHFGCWPTCVELLATGGYVGIVSEMTYIVSGGALNSTHLLISVDLPHSTQDVPVYRIIS